MARCRKKGRVDHVGPWRRVGHHGYLSATSVAHRGTRQRGRQDGRREHGDGRRGTTTVDEEGFVSVEVVLTPDEVMQYREIYDLFLSAIECGDKGSDLGNAEPREQDMWPSVLYPRVLDLPLHERTLRIARRLIGDDAAFDFDMLINKAPATKTPTPWHQDAAY